MDDPARPGPVTSRGSAKRELGLIALTALVVGNMVGSGVFLLPAQLAPFGGTSLIAWLVSAVGTMAFGLVIARLARRQPEVGGPYAYTRSAFGEFAGFLVGWGYWIACWSGVVAVAGAMAGYLGDLWPLAAEHPAVVVLVAILLLTVVNSLGVREAGFVQVSTTVLKLLPLGAIAVVGLFHFEPKHFEPFNPRSQPIALAVLDCLALTLWAFQGFESASIAAGEARDARRNIPRATVIGIVIATVIYVACSLAVMGLVPREALLDSQAPFADAARILWGPWAGKLVAAAGFVSCFGTVNGWILVTARVSLAVARDGLFPAFFARLSARGTPAAGLYLAGALACGLALANYSGSDALVKMVTGITLLATLSALVPYVFCTMAELMLAARARRAGTEKGGSAGTFIALFAYVYGLFTIYGAGAKYVSWGFLLLLGGMPFYVLARARRPS